MAAERVEPVAGSLRSRPLIPARRAGKHESPGRLEPRAGPNRRKCVGEALARHSMTGQDHAESSDFMPGHYCDDAAARFCGALFGWATTPVCPARFRSAAPITTNRVPLSVLPL
jgi:hypothetical protein